MNTINLLTPEEINEDNLVEAVKKNTAAILQISDNTSSNLTVLGTELGDFRREARTELKSVNKKLGELNNRVGGLETAQKETNKKLGELNNREGGLEDSQNETNKRLENLESFQKETNKQLENVEGRLESVEGKLGSMDNRLGNMEDLLRMIAHNTAKMAGEPTG